MEKAPEVLMECHGGMTECGGSLWQSGWIFWFCFVSVRLVDALSWMLSTLSGMIQVLRTKT